MHNPDMWKECTAFAFVLASASLVLGAPEENPWPHYREPARGPARSIGDYSSGCLQGAKALPLDGPGYQVMRPSRRRYFGHPLLIDFIRTLGKRVRSQGLGVLLVGDLSQPRGGRAASGHASHQTGLDVDVWFWHPARARVARLSISDREELVAESVLDAKASSIRGPWKKHVRRVLELSAEDPRVDRVFVNPAIKRELCARRAGARGWLRKIRPWFGHDDHFHVRLACSPTDTDCQSQAPLPDGDGCDKLASWFERPGRASRKPAQRPPQNRPLQPLQQMRREYQQAVKQGRGWPERCEALLEPPAPTNAPQAALSRSDRR